MNLHENTELFKDAINSAARPKDEGGLGISPIFIEKDYWISRSLKLMAENDIDGHAVFKGGTSLTKAYSIGSRFSEDIDIAISEAWELSGNQLKNLIKKTAHKMTEGLEEVVIPNKTSKGSRYYKAYYQYPQVQESSTTTAIQTGQILVEINSFANPYPCEKREIKSFLTEFFMMSGNEDLIEQYNMQPFTVPVLDKRRTLTEKLVSLIRCSLADDYIAQLTAKIRHFYDLHHLMQDSETVEYLESETFISDFTSLLEHDRELFEKPDGWQDKKLEESPLMTDFNQLWSMLESTYLKELPELAYQDVPEPSVIAESVEKVLSFIR